MIANAVVAGGCGGMLGRGTGVGAAAGGTGAAVAGFGEAGVGFGVDVDGTE